MHNDNDWSSLTPVITELNNPETELKKIQLDNPPKALEQQEQPWTYKKTRQHANKQAKDFRKLKGMKDPIIQAGHTVTARHAAGTGIKKEDFDKQQFQMLHSGKHDLPDGENDKELGFIMPADGKDRGFNVRVASEEKTVERTRHKAQDDMLDNEVDRIRATQDGVIRPEQLLEIGEYIRWKTENLPYDHRDVEYVLSNGKKGGQQGGQQQEQQQEGQKQLFEETLQRTGLVESYNINHPDHPVMMLGAEGTEIGGVGNTVGLIEGMENSVEHLLENEHIIAVPWHEKNQPFSDSELQQLLRELAIGVYLYDTVPFFSLHFNTNATMYPVIHPVYKNTLVGEVIGKLDYWMKGFLNGGIFTNKYISHWLKSPTRDSALDVSLALNIEQYCKQHLGKDTQYCSLHTLMDRFNLSDTYTRDDDEKKQSVKALKFKSSFRIIAKQNSIQKYQNVFLLDGDFTVEYTIDQLPEYKAYLQEYQNEYGKDPEEWIQINLVYKTMADLIKELMPKLPLFKPYFVKLNIINFISYYFKTLKILHKVPQFSAINRKPYIFPAILPPLPISYPKVITRTLEGAELISTLSSKDKDQLSIYLITQAEDRHLELKEELKITLRKNILRQKSFIDSTESDEQIDELINKFFAEVILIMKEGLASNEDYDKKIKNLQKKHKETEKNYKAEFKIVQNQLLKEKRNISTEIHTLEQKIKETSLPPGYKLNMKWVNQFKNNLKQNITSNIEKRENFLSETLDHGMQILKETHYQDLIPLQIGILVKKLQKNPLENKVFFQHLKNLKLNCSIFITMLTMPDAKERKLERIRIFGGCGIKLTNRSIETSAAVTKLSECSMVSLIHSTEERFKKIETTTGDAYFAFKLKHNNFLSIYDYEYLWLQNSLVNQKKQSSSVMVKKNNFMTKLQAKDYKAIKKFYTSDLLKFKDRQGCTLLHHAVLTGETDIVKFFLQKGFIVNVGDDDQQTPLHFAATHGFLNIITLLIRSLSFSQHLQLVNKKTSCGANALYLSIIAGHLECVKTLLDFKADPAIRLTNGMTPLHAAFHHQHEDIALVLLGNNSNISKIDEPLEDGTTALYIAVELSMLEGAKKLIECKANINCQRQDKMSPLHTATRHDRLAEVKFLLEAGANVNISTDVKRGTTPLHLAAKHGYYLIVKELLAYKANVAAVNNNHETPLLVAIRNGHLKVAIKLRKLTPSTQENKFKEYAYQTAAQHGLFDLIVDMKLSTSEILKADRHGWSLLHYLVKNGRYDLFSAYTQAIKQKILEELSPNLMEIALQSGCKQMVAYLNRKKFGFGKLTIFGKLTESKIQGQPKPDEDKNTWGIIQYAAYFGYQRILETSYSELGVEQFKKVIPELIFLSASNGQSKTMEWLLEQAQALEIDVQFVILAAVKSGDSHTIEKALIHVKAVNEVTDANGDTFLHKAAYIGDIKLITFLRQRGADFSRRNHQGWTIFHIAAKTENTLLWKYLFDEKEPLPPPDDLIFFLANIEENALVKEVSEKFPQLINYQEPISKNTLLHVIVNRNNADLLLLLKEKVMHLLEICNIQKFTPLTYAVMNDADDCLHILKDWDANIEVSIPTTSLIEEKYPTETKETEKKETKYVLQTFLAKKKQQNNQLKLFPSVEEIDKKEEEEVKLTHLSLMALGIYQHSIRSIQALDPTGTKLAQLHPTERQWLIKKNSHLRPFILSFTKIVENINIYGRAVLNNRLLEAKSIARELRFSWSLYFNVDIRVPENELFFYGKFDVMKMAIFAHRFELVNWLIDENYPMDKSDAEGMSSLHYLVAKEKFDELKKAIDSKKYDLNLLRTNQGSTLLHLAADKAYMKILKYLSKCGADLRSVDNHGVSLAHVAAQAGQMEVLEFLCKKQGYSRLDLTNYCNETPLYWAIQEGHKCIVQFLLQFPIEINRKVTSAQLSYLHVAICAKQADIAFVLLQAGITGDNFDSHGRLALHLAAEQGMDTLVARLLAYKNTTEVVDRTGRTPLHYAALCPKTEVMQFLLKRGAIITPVQAVPEDIKEDMGNIEGRYPQHIAAAKGFSKHLQLLLDYKADIHVTDKLGRTVLSDAVKSCSFPTLALCQKWKLTEESYLKKEPALLRAAWFDKPKVMEYLLDAKQLKLFNSKLLSAAANQGAARVIMLLLDKQLNSSTVTSIAMQEILEHAIIGGHLVAADTILNFIRYKKINIPINSLLIQSLNSSNLTMLLWSLLKGAVITNQPNKFGQTELHIAAAKFQNAIPYLLAVGSNPRIKNIEAKTVLQAFPALDKVNLDLLQAYADTKLPEPPLHRAIRLQNRLGFLFLAAANAGHAIDSKGNNAVHVAVMNQAWWSFNELHRRQVDFTHVNNKRLTPAMVILENFSDTTWEKFLSYGVPFLEKNNALDVETNILFFCWQKQLMTGFKWLLPKIESKDRTVDKKLENSVAKGEIKFILYEILLGLNWRKNELMLPLYQIMINNSHLNLLKLFLDWFGVVDNKQVTIPLLHEAIQKENKPIVELLLERKSIQRDINIPISGKTALTCATDKSYMIKLLLESHANPYLMHEKKTFHSLLSLREQTELDAEQDKCVLQITQKSTIKHVDKAKHLVVALDKLLMTNNTIAAVYLLNKYCLYKVNHAGYLSNFFKTQEEMLRKKYSAVTREVTKQNLPNSTEILNLIDQSELGRYKP